MDVCLNVSCTIVIYKHVHHGKMVFKKSPTKLGEKNLFFFTTCKFVTECHDQNTINDSIIQKKKKQRNKLYDDVVCYSTPY